MKQNDWVVASINNPTFDAGDFLHISNMTLDNTQLLSKDQYLKSRYIRENDLFKDSLGQFSEAKFDQFYKNAVTSFGQFATENVIDNYEYDMFDVMRPDKGKIKDSGFTLGYLQNPDHISVGISGFNEVSKSDKSKRELALMSKIRDVLTGKDLDVSVNNISLFDNPIGYFKSLFDDPLVYATYDKDEEEIDPITGRIIKHYKGEWKVNEDGEYYTEKLNGRSLIGKLVVSALDYLTSEESSVNKYDFFDSDGLDKSIGSSIARDVASVVPLLIPYVGIAYSGILVARELAKSLPMLYGMVLGLSGSDNIDSKFLNTIAAYGDKFTGSTSDYASENTFAFENFSKLMSEVALQWGQQRFIANSFSKLTGGGERAVNTAYAKALQEYLNRAKKGLLDVIEGKLPELKLIHAVGTSNILGLGDEMFKTGKWAETAFGKAALNKYLPAALKLAESRMKTGQDLSLVYMAIVSNTDVYQSILEKGGTPFEAAAITLGSTLGMFAVDKYLGLGEMFFNSEPARQAIRTAARNSANLLMTSAGIREVADVTTKKGFVGLVQKGIRAGKQAVSDYENAIKDRTLGFVGKSLGEGLEEVSEELVSDISKTMGELAGKLGYFSLDDYGAWENAFDRYTMSFLGGAAGGGLFYGIDVIQNGNKNTLDFQNDIIYLLRLGKKKELLDEITKLRNNGKLGSKLLSYNVVTGSDGKAVPLTAETENQSLSDYVYNTLVKTINLLDLILNENQLGLSDSELFDKMVLGEYRTDALSDFLKGDKEKVKEISYITRYLEDFLKLVNQIANKEAEILKEFNSTEDSARSSLLFKDKIERLKAEKQQLLEQKDYLFGEGSLGYVEKMLFAMDTSLAGKFMSLSYRQFVRHNSGKAVEDLSEAESEYYTKLYALYSKNSKKATLDEAFKMFKDIQAKINPEILALQERDISREIEEFKLIAELDPFSKLLTFDSRLEGESDEDFNERYIKRESETPELFLARQKKRAENINNYNMSNLSTWISELSSRPIDRGTFRTVYAKRGLLRKNRFDLLVEQFSLPSNVELLKEIWDAMKTIGIEKKNRKKLRLQVKDLIRKHVEVEFNKEYSDRLGLNYWEDAKDYFGYYVSELDPEEKVRLGYGEDFFYNGEALTKRDLANYIYDKIQREALNGNIIEDIEEYLSKAYGWEFPTINDDGKIVASELAELNKRTVEYYRQVLPILTNDEEALKAYPQTLIDSLLEEGNEPVEMTDELYETLIDEAVEQNFLDHWKTINKVIKSINKDKDLKALTDLEGASFVNNPIMPLLSKISKQVREGDLNIEQFLLDIFNQYHNGESALSFELSGELLKTLNQIKEDLELASAFIHAASVRSDYANPVGHNKSINEFTANHSDVFGKVEPLPEILDDIASFLINELNNYRKEINTWINLSQSNIADKVEKFVKSETAFNKARTKFYKVNRDAFKVSSDLDLLDGYENIKLDDSLSSLILIEELLHRNYKKAIKKGHTLEEILDAVMSVMAKSDGILAQNTAKLDEDIEYKHLSYYDRFAFVISNFALSSADFYTKLKDFILKYDNVAPLSILEYAAKLALAQQANPEVINKALKWLANKTGSKLGILENATIITGVGGSGKTFAVTKLSTDGTDTWLTGPTSSLVDGLLEVLPKGEAKLKLDLFTIMLGSEKDAKEFLDEVTFDTETNRWKAKTGKYFTPPFRGGLKNSTVTLKESVKVAKIDNAPKLLIVDEATHYNTAELLLMSKFCKENGINLILLGDDTQNGKSYPGLMYNMGPHGLLAWRAPKLFISLRDNNVQKVRNLKGLINIVDTLEATPEGDEALIETTKKLLDNEYKNLAFRYYNGTEFNGELITSSIPQDVITKLSGSVGFIGKESSEAYKLLKNSGKNPILIDPLSVQGREFDYVVVDKDWSIPTIDSDLAKAGREIKTFIKDLYTMISRSRKGTIIIDNNNISKVVSNVEDDFTGTSSSIKNAISKFKETRLAQIEEALSKIKPEEEEEEGKEDTTKPTKEIKGTTLTTDDLGKDDTPGLDNSEDRKKELELAKLGEKAVYLNMTTPIRVYGNVSCSGINTALKEWSNPTDTKKDLGIFLRPGETITNGRDKYKLVKKLLDVKSLLLYNYGELSQEILDIIPQEAFNNVEYYVSVEDESNNNRLVGLPSRKDKNGKPIGNGLSNEDRAINGKVVTVVAKIPVEKNGVTTVYEVTLGGLADPKTWKDNEDKIRASINKRIEEMKNAGEDTTELLQYVDLLGSNILAYKNSFAELTTKNLERRINKPNFSGMTTLVDAKSRLRLESINVVTDDEGLRLSNYKPFKEACPYSVVSKVYAITAKRSEMAEKFPGIDPNLAGKAVIYVSNNTLLTPDLLEGLYMELKANPDLADLVPQVRMIVLDNMGVSFQSLYRKGYSEIYSVKQGETVYTNPFEAEPMGVRMYISMWNFRSNLKMFNLVYKEWLEKNNLDEEEVEKLCKLDNTTFNSIKGDSEYLSEEEYRNRVPEDVKNLLKVIWDFNDSLAESVRQFRLGYSSENGAYLRKLTNLKEGGFYEKIDNVVGIYINPKMAQQFEGMLDALFTNIIDKVVPPARDPRYYITTKLSDLNKPEADGSINSWFDLVKKDREISISMMDENGNPIGGTLNFAKDNALSAIPSLIIETAKFLEQRSWNPITLDEKLENPKETRWRIKFGDEELDWRSIADPNILIGGQVATENSENFVEGSVQPGIRPLYDEGGDLSGLIDKRIDNMFNLMFHGTIATKYLNDFNSDDIRATDAYFKYGFKADPVLIPKTGDLENPNAAVLTNMRLFASNVVPGLPMFGISLDEYVEEGITTEEAPEETPAETNTELKQSIDTSVNILALSGITLTQNNLEKIKNILDLYNLVVSKINSKFDEYFISRRSTPLDKLIMGATLNGNTIEFTYFPSRPEFNGEIITSAEWKMDVLEVTTLQGTSYNVYRDGNDLIIKSVIMPQSNNKSISLIKSDILNITDSIIEALKKVEKTDDTFEGYSEDTQNLITEVFTSSFVGNGENDTASPETTRTVINKVLKLLEEIADDINDTEFSQTTSDVIDKLTELKNTECPI